MAEAPSEVGDWRWDSIMLHKSWKPNFADKEWRKHTNKGPWAGMETDTVGTGRHSFSYPSPPPSKKKPLMYIWHTNTTSEPDLLAKPSSAWRHMAIVVLLGRGLALSQWKMNEEKNQVPDLKKSVTYKCWGRVAFSWGKSGAQICAHWKNTNMKRIEISY